MTHNWINEWTKIVSYEYYDLVELITFYRGFLTNSLYQSVVKLDNY